MKVHTAPTPPAMNIWARSKPSPARRGNNIGLTTWKPTMPMTRPMMAPIRAPRSLFVGRGLFGSGPESERLMPRSLQLRQLKRRPPFAVEQLVVAVVACKLPALRIPAQPAVVPVGQIAEMAHGHRAGADLDVADRGAARADAVQPVAEVPRRTGQVHVLVADRDL